jgi:ATP-dependent DNA helicase Q4
VCSGPTRERSTRRRPEIQNFETFLASQEPLQPALSLDKPAWMKDVEEIHSDEEDWVDVRAQAPGAFGAEFGIVSVDAKALRESGDQDGDFGNPFLRSRGGCTTSSRPRPRQASGFARKMFVGKGVGGGGEKADAVVMGLLDCSEVLQSAVQSQVSASAPGARSTGSRGVPASGGVGSFLGREVSLERVVRASSQGHATELEAMTDVVTDGVTGGKSAVGAAAKRAKTGGPNHPGSGQRVAEAELKENLSDHNSFKMRQREDGMNVISMRHGGRTEMGTLQSTATAGSTALNQKPKKATQAGWGNNFVRLNMKKGGKDFARVKGGSKRFKPGRGRRSSKWRVEPLRAVGDGESYLSGWEKGSGLRCFKCGQVGHFASACIGVDGADGVGEGVDGSDGMDGLGPMSTMGTMGMTGATGSLSQRHNLTCSQESPALQHAQLSGPPALQLLPEVTPPPLSPIDVPTSEELHEMLKDKFGHDEFRGSQLETIVQILSGKSCLNIMPTGMGKSLCYQLPAFLMSRPVVVISPLIALMQDQCAAAPPELNAAVLWSGQTPNDALQILSNVRQGTTKLLFISPERASNEILLEALRPWLPLQLLVIDEAHCISEWGHSFRPSYYRLGKVIRSQLPSQSILALTATATLTTEACITQILDIPKANTFRHKGMHPNLRLNVDAIGDFGQGKWEVIAKKILPQLKTCRRAILYCSFRRDADTLARVLVVGGIRAKSYHSGVFMAERERILSSFAKGTLNVVVATTAFGMGINIAHVDAVYHVSMPRSLEEYVQQIGRAGRSGDVAKCLCFINKADFLTLRSLASNPYVRPEAVGTIIDAIFPIKDARGVGEYRVLDLRKILAGKIPEETIESIICYLENLETPLLHFAGQVPLKARVSFYAKRPEEMDDPIVETILKACPKPRQGVYHVEVSKMCTENGASPAKNFQQLSAMSKRKLIGFQPSKERGLCYRIESASVSRTDIVEEVSTWLQKMNSMIIHKLDIAYKAFEVASTTPGGADAQEQALRSIVEHYFAEPGDDFDKFLEGVVSKSGVDAELVKSGDESTVSAARLVLRRAKEHNIDVTSVEICAILHGIMSGMDKTKSLQQIMSLFWGRLKHVDHRDVLAAAERAIVEAK